MKLIKGHPLPNVKNQGQTALSCNYKRSKGIMRMRNQAILVVISTLFLMTLNSCSFFFGPKQEEVVVLTDALCRSIYASFKNDPNPEVNSHYANAADVTFKSSDNTLIHRCSYFCDTENGLFSTKGALTLSNYHDSESGYIFNGTYNYSIKIPRNCEQHTWFGKADIALQLSGGKISDISTAFHKEEGGNLTYEYYTINGRPFRQSQLKIAGGIAESIIAKALINNPC